jgi:amidophosphoribosyltransferase
MGTRSKKEVGEECGVIGIYSKKGANVAPLIYNALLALQHRGQDAAGFIIYNGKEMISRKGIGLVSEIFKKEDIKIEGAIGIGHTRYPTTGRCLIEDVQPSISENVAVAHNGHLANYREVRTFLENEGYKFSSTVDSELIAHLLHKKIKEEKTIEDAVKYAMETLDGAYSDAAIVNGKLVIFRDPHAIRPLVYGENEEYVCFTSESVALDINNIEYKGVVDGGEIVIVDETGIKKQVLMKKETRHCMFEYVYFSRPDSRINDKYVFEVREALGEQLAIEHPVKADVVIPVPDTARTAAEGYSRVSGISLKEGLIKNRYVGRTFIMPAQEQRANAVKIKLNAIKKIIDGKRVVLIDDSIVRGTTMREIVALVRKAGAKEIHVRITCPPLKAPCFYGVDMATYDELIAHKKSIEEIRNYLGVESLGYISIEGLKKAIGQPICTGCLNEDYPTKGAKDAAQKVALTKRRVW